MAYKSKEFNTFHWIATQFQCEWFVCRDFFGLKGLWKDFVLQLPIRLLHNTLRCEWAVKRNLNNHAFYGGIEKWHTSEKCRIICHIIDIHWVNSGYLGMNKKKSKIFSLLKTTILTLANTYLGRPHTFSNVNQSQNIYIIKFSTGCRSRNRWMQGNISPQGNRMHIQKEMPPKENWQKFHLSINRQLVFAPAVCARRNIACVCRRLIYILNGAIPEWQLTEG